jgi:hypothetical protein
MTLSNSQGRENEPKPPLHRLPALRLTGLPGDYIFNGAIAINPLAG